MNQPINQRYGGPGRYRSFDEYGVGAVDAAQSESQRLLLPGDGGDPDVWVTTTPATSAVVQVLRILGVLLGILHALTCVVFLVVVYSGYRALQDLGDQLDQLGSMWGG